MALEKTISSQYGLDGNYIKIEKFHGDKDNMRVDVVLFANSQARSDCKQPLQYWLFEMPTPSGTGNDLLVDLYNHLKTLPEFSGAIDV